MGKLKTTFECDSCGEKTESEWNLPKHWSDGDIKMADGRSCNFTVCCECNQRYHSRSVISRILAKFFGAS